MDGIGSIPPQYVEALLVRARLPQAQPQTSCGGGRGSEWHRVALSAQRCLQRPRAALRPQSCRLGRSWRWPPSLGDSPGPPHQRCATLSANGWLGRALAPRAAHFWRQPILPPPALPAIGEVPSQGQLHAAPGSCGSFTHRISVLAQRSPSIKTPGVGATGRALQLWGCGVVAGSSSSTWPASTRQRWSCYQRLQVGVWDSHNSYSMGVRRQQQQPRACPCKWYERWAGT
jgi:hypothetical protein